MNEIDEEAESYVVSERHAQIMEEGEKFFRSCAVLVFGAIIMFLAAVGYLVFTF